MVSLTSGSLIIDVTIEDVLPSEITVMLSEFPELLLQLLKINIAQNIEIMIFMFMEFIIITI
ncbi:hypothetical protein FACS1894132_01800 [Clostridia bacterium]|nr:hypothetical protein FACS1894132_01800 [Clostridia bacterium]